MPKPSQLDEVIEASDKLASDALARARAKSPLAADLIARFEESLTRSASVLREKAYATMALHGVDVPLLVADARDRVVQRRRARVRHSRKLATLLRRRVDSGEFARQLAKKAEKAGVPAPTREEIERKVAEAQARLAAAPKRWAEYEKAIELVMRRPRQWPTDPTPERRAQAGEDPRIIRTMPFAGKSSPKAHRFDAPLEKMMHALTADEYKAGDDLRWAWEKRQGRRAQSDYGLGRGQMKTTAEKLKAESHEPATARADRMWNFFWLRLSPAFKEVCKVLLFQQEGPNGEAALTPEEWGKRYGRTKDARRAIGVAEGALKATCGRLAEINREYRAWRNEVKGQAAETVKRRAFAVGEKADSPYSRGTSLWDDKWTKGANDPR